MLKHIASKGLRGLPSSLDVLYVEQEPARGQDLEGGAEWTVADALTEPMAAGESASTPGATETADAVALKPKWMQQRLIAMPPEAKRAELFDLLPGGTITFVELLSSWFFWVELLITAVAAAVHRLPLRVGVLRRERRALPRRLHFDTARRAVVCRQGRQRRGR